MLSVDLYPELPVESEPGSVVEVASNFRAMNTNIDILIYTSDISKATDICYAIEAMFNQTEAVLSRFRASSELSRLNQQGYAENASELLFENVQAAYQMAELTEGVFDPTILDALEAAGYDRSFELVVNASEEPRLFNQPRILFQQGWQNMVLYPASRTVRLPFGIRIDLGGIAKGTTVDRAKHLLQQAGFDSFMISAGGDMYLQGCPPRDEGWVVGIENPLALPAQEIMATIKVSGQAVATSSTMGRRWLDHGKARHHLIDPRTGQPVDSHIAAVTAQATSVQLADVMAKTALILGPELSRRRLKKISGLISLLFVTSEGKIVEL